LKCHPRAFLQEVRTFLSDPESEERLGSIRHLIGSDRSSPAEHGGRNSHGIPLGSGWDGCDK